jgi:hypothetical protein
MPTRLLREILADVWGSHERLDHCHRAGKVVLENNDLFGKAWQIRRVATGRPSSCVGFFGLMTETPMKQTLHWTFQMLEVNFDYHKQCKRFLWKDRSHGIDIAIQRLQNAIRGLGEVSWVSRLLARDDAPPLPDDYPSQLDTWADVPVVVWLVPVWDDTPSRRTVATADDSRSVRPRKGCSPYQRPPPPPPLPRGLPSRPVPSWPGWPGWQLADA